MLGFIVIATLVVMHSIWREDSLRLALFLRHSDTIGVGERDAMCADRRRHAIMGGAHDESASVSIPAEVFIRLQAGARLVGFDSLDDYFADLWRGEEEAILDFAQSETGKREIPLTRHERAALDRLRAERKSA